MAIGTPVVNSCCLKLTSLGFSGTGAGDSVFVLMLLLLLLLSSSSTAGAAAILVDGVATDTVAIDDKAEAALFVVAVAVASDLGDGEMFWRVSVDSEEAEEGMPVARDEGL